MSTDNSIYIADITFPEELCNNLVDFFEKKIEIFTSEHFLQNNDGMERKDEAVFVDDVMSGGISASKEYALDMLNDTGSMQDVNEINEYLTAALQEYIGTWSGLTNMSIRSTRQKLQKTQKGGGYHLWHHEQSDVDSSQRVLVWTIYLNDVEEGGETEFLHQSVRVKAKKGKIVIFPACFTHVHRGNPPLSGDKYILTGWWNLF